MWPRAYTVSPQVYMRTVLSRSGAKVLLLPGQGVIETHRHQAGRGWDTDSPPMVTVSRPLAARNHRPGSRRVAAPFSACRRGGAHPLDEGGAGRGLDAWHIPRRGAQRRRRCDRELLRVVLGDVSLKLKRSGDS